MDAWVLWLIAAGVRGVGEILTAGFFLAPFAVGALRRDARRAGRAAAPSSSGVVFAALTLASFALIRPIASSHMHTPPQHPHRHRRADRHVARSCSSGSPTTRASAASSIDGEVWTARAYDDDVVDRGRHAVEVVEIRGATALVAPMIGESPSIHGRADRR